MKIFEIEKKILLANFIIIFFLISSTFLFGSYLRPALENILWVSDDVIHIDVANSFKEKKNFERTFVTFRNMDVNDVIEQTPTITREQQHIGPLYYVLLGSFYDVLETEPEEFYLHGSIFNNILGSIFLVIFFIFVQKKYNLKIALFSSLLIAFLPYLVYTNSRVMLNPLLFIFSISSLFFLEKTKQNYLIFGILIGLAHLVHPFGIFLGASYGLFLLINKEFRGFFIVLISWHLVLLPVFIRNFFIFKDFGMGLYIPFSSRISEFFTFSSEENIIINELDSVIFSRAPTLLLTDPFQHFALVFQRLSDFYSMGLLILFLIIFSWFAYFKLNRIGYYKKYIVIIFSIIILSYFLIYHVSNSYLQIVFAFIIPIIFIYFLYKKKKLIFEKNLPRINHFIVFFLFTSLVISFIMNLFFVREIPDSRILIFPIILLIPLSLLGLEKIIQNYKPRKKTMPSIIVTLLVGLIILPLVFQMAGGLIFLNNFDLTQYQSTLETKKINKWLSDNVVQGPVASNFPGHTFLETGMQSIKIPTFENGIYPIIVYDKKQTEILLDYYEISYLVVYDIEGLKHESVSKNLLSGRPLHYNFLTKYNAGNSLVLEATPIIDLDVNINNTTLYLRKAILLEESGRFEESNEILTEFRQFDPNDITIQEEICISLTYYNFYEESNYSCNKILQKYPTNLIALHNLAIGFVNTEQKDKVYEILAQYDKIIQEPNDKQILKPWGETINYLIQFDSSYNEIPNNLFLKIKSLEEQGDLLRVLRIIERLGYVDAFSLDVHESAARVLTKIGKYEEALQEYDFTIKIYYNEINKLQSAGQYGEANEMQKSLINLMKAKATLLINLEDFHKANRVYLEILSIDKFDPDVYKKIAVYHEKYGQLRQALQNYELASQLEPENDFLIEKIKELKDKIAV